MFEWDTRIQSWDAYDAEGVVQKRIAETLASYTQSGWNVFQMLQSCTDRRVVLTMVFWRMKPKAQGEA